jgi:hypothetical protein
VFSNVEAIEYRPCITYIIPCTEFHSINAVTPHFLTTSCTLLQYVTVFYSTSVIVETDSLEIELLSALDLAVYLAASGESLNIETLVLFFCFLSRHCLTEALFAGPYFEPIRQLQAHNLDIV